MGTFLSVTGVIGQPLAAVSGSLNSYATMSGGGLEKETLPVEHNNCCVMKESNGNVSILYPAAYLAWDQTAAFISKDLNAPVFSFHIHDGDFWMYTLLVNGAIADQFNPIPDYWNDKMPSKEIQRWKGSAATVARFVSHVKQADIERYLVRWDADTEEETKAYPDDEFSYEDWQLLDFMKKLSLPYPLDDDGKPGGETYRLWTQELLWTQQAVETNHLGKNLKKPWWKIW